MGVRIHPNPRKPLHDRLWAKINKAGPDDCWLWTANRSALGYGRISSGGKYGPQLIASRAVYTDAVGPIPDGHRVLHRCDNPPCCNPKHLFTGTDKDNSDDMIVKGRKRWRASQGTAHGSAKLTDAKVQRIRKAKGSQREIAKQFGVSQSTIWLIKSKKVWKHI